MKCIRYKYNGIISIWAENVFAHEILFAQHFNISIANRKYFILRKATKSERETKSLVNVVQD